MMKFQTPSFRINACQTEVWKSETLLHLVRLNSQKSLSFWQNKNPHGNKKYWEAWRWEWCPRTGYLTSLIGYHKFDLTIRCKSDMFHYVTGSMKLYTAGLAIALLTSSCCSALPPNKEHKDRVLDVVSS